MTIALVNAEGTVLVNIYPQDDAPAIVEVATRTDPGDTWGPPRRVRWDGYGGSAIPTAVRIV